MNLHTLNYGKILAYAGVVLSAAASIGYFCAGDYRRCAYYFFAACITVTVTA